MTERTRWDALAEELELKDEPVDSQVEPCTVNPEVTESQTDEIPYTRYARVASDPPTTSSSEGKVTWGVLRGRFERPDAGIRASPAWTTSSSQPQRAQVLVMLMVDGVSIGPVTDVSMTMEKPYDEACSRSYGIDTVGPPRVSGSFQAPVINVSFLQSGIDMMLALIRDDGNLYFKIRVAKTTWSISSPTDEATTRIDFTGIQID